MSNLKEIILILRAKGKTDTEILDALCEATEMADILIQQATAKLPERDQIKQMLDALGMSTTSKGYFMWVDAIEMYIASEKKAKIGKIREKLAAKYESTPSSVAVTMTRSVEKAISNCSQKNGERIFGKERYGIIKREGLTCREFLEHMAHRL